MSKKQWGNGYHAGYQDALYDTRRQRTFEEEPYAHWVDIHWPYKDTYEPINHQQCTFLGDHTCENGGGGCGFNRYVFDKKMTRLLCSGPPAPMLAIKKTMALHGGCDE